MMGVEHGDPSRAAAIAVARCWRSAASASRLREAAATTPVRRSATRRPARDRPPPPSRRVRYGAGALGAQPRLRVGGRRPAQRIRPSPNGIRAPSAVRIGQVALHPGGAGPTGGGLYLPPVHRRGVHHGPDVPGRVGAGSPARVSSSTVSPRPASSSPRWATWRRQSSRPPGPSTRAGPTARRSPRSPHRIVERRQCPLGGVLPVRLLVERTGQCRRRLPTSFGGDEARLLALSSGRDLQRAGLAVRTTADPAWPTRSPSRVTARSVVGGRPPIQPGAQIAHHRDIGEHRAHRAPAAAAAPRSGPTPSARPGQRGPGRRSGSVGQHDRGPACRRGPFEQGVMGGGG